MSCPNATTPIDIDSTKTAGKCSLKCELSFHFSNINTCIATHRGNYISLSHDPVNTEALPVTYNKVGYSVRDIRLYAPSIHTYVGTQTAAELVIIHSSTTGAKPLLICIPIKEGSDSDGGLLTEIINAVADNAPADGDQTTLAPSRAYTLNSLVPRKPYFVYSGTEPFQPCSKQVEFVVYAPHDNATITLQSSTLETLKSIIEPHPFKVVPGAANKPRLFRNDIGPGSGADSDDIYIDCQPVNQSEDTVTIGGSSSSSSSSSAQFSWKSLKSNVALQFVLGLLAFICLGGIVFAAIKAIASSVSTTRPKMAGGAWRHAPIL